MKLSLIVHSCSSVLLPKKSLFACFLLNTHKVKFLSRRVKLITRHKTSNRNRKLVTSYLDYLDFKLPSPIIPNRRSKPDEVPISRQQLLFICGACLRPWLSRFIKKLVLFFVFYPCIYALYVYDRLCIVYNKAGVGWRHHELSEGEGTQRLRRIVLFAV